MKNLRHIRMEPKPFTINKTDGIKQGFTYFYDDKRKIEAKYFYTEDVCDYLKSEGFEQDSIGFRRQRSAIKENKKKGLKKELDMVRFYSIDKGFYSLNDLYVDKINKMNTPIERLESIHRKLASVQHLEMFLERWCKASICGCMGCGNRLLSWAEQEYLDYKLWRRYNNLLSHES